jgi:hypothetical protein
LTPRTCVYGHVVSSRRFAPPPEQTLFEVWYWHGTGSRAKKARWNRHRHICETYGEADQLAKDIAHSYGTVAKVVSVTLKP